MSVYPSWSTDYVDIYGRNLNVMVDDEGAIFVPLQEIKRIGFHIFPKSNFNPVMVGKAMVMKELRLHMLGAATEFLLQNNVRSMTHEDILGTIELCIQELDRYDDQNNKRNNTGLLGRTLLADPNEVNKSVTPLLQKIYNRGPAANSSRLNVGNITEGEPSHGYNSHEQGHSLRMPHQQKNLTNHGSTNSADSANNFRKARNVSTRDQNGRQDALQNGRQDAPQNDSSRNGSKKPQQNRSFGNHDRSFGNQDRNFGNQDRSNFVPNAKMGARRENNSKSGSENGDVEFLRLSDCKVDRIQLQKNMQKVKVVYIESNNDKEKYWVHLVENEKKVLEIVELCLDQSDSAPSITPKLGEICMAMSIEDDLWYRVVVQRLSPYIKVHFIDFGNDAIVSHVKKLPAELKDIPAQAVRITMSRPEGQTQGQTLKMDQVISVRFIKQFTDGTSLVTADHNNVGQNNYSRGAAKAVTPERQAVSLEPTFMDRIKYSTVLMDKELVRIISHSEGRFYLRNREHHDKLKDIVTLVKDLPKDPVGTPEVGQVVLCKKEGEEQLCRAIVRKIDDGLVTVQYLDFQTLDALSIRSLCGISKAAANLPVALIESPVIKGFDAAKFGPESESLIEQMITNKSKLTVRIHRLGDSIRNGGEFDLMLNGKSFSEMVFPAGKKIDVRLKSPKEPSPEKSKVVEKSPQPVVELSDAACARPEPVAAAAPKPEKPATSRRESVPARPTPAKPAPANPAPKVLFEDMPSYVAPVGKDDYMLTAFKDCGDFTVTPTGDKESELLARCTCIDVVDDEPYDPEADGEMVLARFEGDWFRGAVMEKSEDGKYNILFVEYGNQIEVTKEEIRRFPQELKEIPMMGIMCCIDLPETEAVKKRLQEVFKLESIYEIDIISHDTENLIYTVEIPKIKELLVREELI